MMKKRSEAFAIGVAAIFAVGALLAGEASGIVLEFDDVTTQGGTISYNGAGGALVGSNILFDQVLGIGTPTHDGVALTIEGGALNFATGSFASQLVPGVLAFDGGGTFVLTGAIPGLGLGPGTTLLTGSFRTSQAPPLVSGFTSLIFSGFGVDFKDSALLAHYGLDRDSNFTFANAIIASDAVLTGKTLSEGFTATVKDADLANVAVPDGGITAVLLGISLIGILGAYRKDATPSMAMAR